MMNLVYTGKILFPGETMDLAGSDSPMLAEGYDANCCNNYIFGSQKIHFVASDLSEDCTLHPDTATRARHGLFSSDTPAVACNILLPIGRTRVGNSGRQLRSPVSPTVGSIGDVHQDACGSMPLADVLTLNDTSSSINIVSLSSYDSQNDLGDLSQATYPGRTGRPSLVSVLPHFAAFEYEDKHLRFQKARSFDGGRHHGGDAAATALRNETARQRHACHGSEPGKSIPNLEPAQNPNGCAISCITQKPADSNFNSSGFQEPRPVRPCSRQLYSDAPDVMNADVVPELSFATRSSSARACDTWEEPGSPLRALLSDKRLHVDVQWTNCGLPLEGSMDAVQLCPPFRRLKALAEPCMTMTATPLVRLSPCAPGSVSAASPSSVAFAPPSTPFSPMDTSPSCRTRIPRFARGAVAAATEAAAQTCAVVSPTSACVYDGSMVVLDHDELPDDSVHGGRPRHPSVDASVQPCGSQLLEWAESGTVSNSIKGTIPITSEEEELFPGRLITGTLPPDEV